MITAISFIDRQSVKKLTLSAFMLAHFTSCNDTQTDNQASLNPSTDSSTLRRDLINVINQNALECEGEDCDLPIVKIISSIDGKIKTCTGFVVEPQTVATSSNCLGDTLRVSHANCKDRVFFYTAGREGEERRAPIECSKVLFASSSPESGILLRGGDVAYLKTQTPLNKTPLRFSSEGMGDREELHTWAVSQYSESHAKIQKSNCKSTLNSYANPFAQSPLSPVIPLVGCVFHQGNEGAPVINSKGRVVGIWNQKVPASEFDYLVINDLIDIASTENVSLSSNIACSPQVGAMANYCDSKPTELEVQESRGRLLNNLEQHQAVFAQIESFFLSEVENVRQRFINWKMEISRIKPGILEILPTPSCFYRVQDWIDDLKVPVIFWEYKKSHSFDTELTDFEVRTSFDQFLKPFSNIIDKGQSKLKTTFSPKHLVQRASSTVETVWNGKKKVFQSILRSDEETCP